MVREFSQELEDLTCIPRSLRAFKTTAHNSLKSVLIPWKSLGKDLLMIPVEAGPLCRI